jgi:hypothetical protein
MIPLGAHSRRMSEARAMERDSGSECEQPLRPRSMSSSIDRARRESYCCVVIVERDVA